MFSSGSNKKYFFIYKKFGNLKIMEIKYNKLKSSFVIFLTIFSLLACECVNDVNTEKENIPNQNTEISIINLLDNNKSLATYCNDIFIEDLDFKVYNSIPKKYMSGRFVLSFREKEEVIYISSLNLLESERYFSFIYENQKQKRFIIRQAIKNNIRVWNLNDTSIDLTLFSNNFLYNSVIKNNSIEEFQINNFPVNFNLSLNGLNINKDINLNNISEIVIYNNQILTFEY